MDPYQLRGGTVDNDTGELIHEPDFKKAFEKFINEEYWKLSFTMSTGRRIRLVKIGERTLDVTYPDEWAPADYE